MLTQTNLYIFYEVSNICKDLTRPILYDLSWLVGLGAGLQLIKYIQFSKNHMNL